MKPLRSRRTGAAFLAWDERKEGDGNYSVPSGDFWSFAQFGGKVIACNFNDNPQVIDVDTGAVNFADLAGTPPKARLALGNVDLWR